MEWKRPARLTVAIDGLIVWRTAGEDDVCGRGFRRGRDAGRALEPRLRGSGASECQAGRHPARLGRTAADVSRGRAVCPGCKRVCGCSDRVSGRAGRGDGRGFGGLRLAWPLRTPPSRRGSCSPGFPPGAAAGHAGCSRLDQVRPMPLGSADSRDDGAPSRLVRRASDCGSW